MLSTTQLIIFELGSQCNLGNIHKECPNATRKATGLYELTDEIISQCITDAYTKLNFTGLVGWHFHNEPMIQHERMFSLMEENPVARYVLWTNGTIQPDDGRINLFEQVYCTDYTGVNADYYKGCKSITLFPFKRFDKRIQDTNNLSANNRRCLRQHVEFILDNWGTVILCCQDWRGEVKLGNIWTDNYITLASRRHKILEEIRRGEHPEKCLRCQEKVGLPKFDRVIYQRTRKFIDVN